MAYWFENIHYSWFQTKTKSPPVWNVKHAVPRYKKHRSCAATLMAAVLWLCSVFLVLWFGVYFQFGFSFTAFHLLFLSSFPSSCHQPNYSHLLLVLPAHPFCVSALVFPIVFFSGSLCWRAGLLSIGLCGRSGSSCSWCVWILLLHTTWIPFCLGPVPKTQVFQFSCL